MQKTACAVLLRSRSISLTNYTCDLRCTHNMPSRAGSMPLAHAECAVRMPLRHHTYLHTNPWFDCAMSHVPVYGHRAHAVLRRMPESGQMAPRGAGRRSRSVRRLVANPICVSISGIHSTRSLPPLGRHCALVPGIQSRRDLAR